MFLLNSYSRSNFFKPSGEVELFDFDIPKTVLQNLNDVNLECNKLTMVPPCIFKMKTLVFFNLSR